jgi:hypothetical protein
MKLVLRRNGGVGIGRAVFFAVVAILRAGNVKAGNTAAFAQADTGTETGRAAAGLGCGVVYVGGCREVYVLGAVISTLLPVIDEPVIDSGNRHR